ncbi:hypothetical protein [Psychromicrobium lacuslunae]|uniref:HEAT repeat domain-containing protein n=1 Tax=Psychromicrobium lacuslunae TaxID=1618207 RepID=A0A0D4C1X2_9MICC|nr:hypothetical protein [Psychromicrobium lacuslunae]AJT42672.1 hypothetical protein UM93_16500 [Psychromicrobium lacuslunae]
MVWFTKKKNQLWDSVALISRPKDLPEDAKKLRPEPEVGITFTRGRQVETLFPRDPDFSKNLIDWVDNYQDRLPAELHKDFKVTFQRVLISLEGFPEITSKAIKLYGSWPDDIKNFRGNLILAITLSGTDENYQEILELAQQDTAWTATDILIGEYLCRYRTEEVRRLIVEAMKHAPHRHYTARTAAQWGLTETIPSVSAALELTPANNFVEKETLQRALHTLRKKDYLNRMKSAKSPAESFDIALADLDKEELAPYAAYHLGRLKDRRALTALKLASNSKQTKLRQEAKAAVKKLEKLP